MGSSSHANKPWDLAILDCALGKPLSRNDPDTFRQALCRSFQRALQSPLGEGKIRLEAILKRSDLTRAALQHQLDATKFSLGMIIYLLKIRQ